MWIICKRQLEKKCVIRYYMYNDKFTNFIRNTIYVFMGFVCWWLWNHDINILGIIKVRLNQKNVLNLVTGENLYTQDTSM